MFNLDIMNNDKYLINYLNKDVIYTSVYRYKFINPDILLDICNVQYDRTVFSNSFVYKDDKIYLYDYNLDLPFSFLHNFYKKELDYYLIENEKDLREMSEKYIIEDKKIDYIDSKGRLHYIKNSDYIDKLPLLIITSNFNKGLYYNNYFKIMSDNKKHLENVIKRKKYIRHSVKLGFFTLFSIFVVKNSMNEIRNGYNNYNVKELNNIFIMPP